MPREVPSSSQHWEPWGPVHPVPPCVLGTHTRSLSPIRQGSQSRPRFPCSTATLDVTMALIWHRWAGAWWGCAMGLRDVGTGVSEPSPRLGGLAMSPGWWQCRAWSCLSPATLCSDLQACPSHGAAPAPSAHGGLPQQKAGSGPHGAGAAGGLRCQTWLHLPCSTASPGPGSPKPWQAWLFWGVIFATLKGALCNLGSWKPGVVGSSVGCGGGHGAWLCPRELCRAIQCQPDAPCPWGQCIWGTRRPWGCGCWSGSRRTEGAGEGSRRLLQ